MSGSNFVMSITIAIFALGTVTSAYASDTDSTLHSDLARIANQRIFFGHQSVGMNLLDGIKQLSATTGVPVHIVESTTAKAVPPATMGHTFVSENKKPIQKLKSFELAMEQQSGGLDIALVKFCYIDFMPETDIKMLFSEYQATIDRLRGKNPGTAFVHVTAPLTVVSEGIKSRLKKILGHAPYGTLENMRREEYNTLLRQAYQGREPIFDLARIESTAPDGTAVSVSWEGRDVPAMASDYTNDGGHLNTTGKLRAARELISVLASIPNQPVFSKKSH